MRTAIRRNTSGGVVASRSVASASCTSGCSTTCTGTQTLYYPAMWYNFQLKPEATQSCGREPATCDSACNRCFMLLRLTFLLLAGGLVAGQAAPRQVSLIVTNGIVVTMDGGRPGAVAGRGGDRRPRHRRGRHRRRRLPRPTAAATRSTPRGDVVMPGLINTHTHAPMVLYRGLADDLALMDWLQKYIFPAEAKTVTPEFVRAGTRLAALEMIRSGTTTYADMYYFEEEIARVDEGRRPARRARPDDHPVPGRRREDARRGAGAHRAVHQGVRQRRADRAGGRAARDVHARRRDAEGVPGSSPIATRVPVIIHLAETEDEVEDRRREAQGDAGRLPRVARLLGAADARRARRPRDAGRHPDPRRRAASASRTTPRAT